MAQPSTTARIGNFVHVAVFVGLLWLPLAAALLRLEHRDVLAENRALAPLPRLGTDKIASLAGKFDKYYNDHFGLRNALIWTHDLLKVRYLGGEANSKEVIEGKDGWLFYCGLGVEENHQGLRPSRRNNSRRGRTSWRESGVGWRDEESNICSWSRPTRKASTPNTCPPICDAPGPPRSWTSWWNTCTSIPTWKSSICGRRCGPPGTRATFTTRHDTHWNDRGALAGYREISTACNAISRN